MLRRRRRLRRRCVGRAPETSKVENQYSQPVKGSVFTATTRSTSKLLRRYRRDEPETTFERKQRTFKRPVLRHPLSVCAINLRDERWEMSVALTAATLR